MGNTQTQEVKKASEGPLAGRVAIVTGANTGLGLLTAGCLCRDGCHVIFACRSEEKGTAAVEKIKGTIPGASATFIQLDLLSSDSVYNFVESFHNMGLPLHILVNNAGMGFGFYDKTRVTTPQGFETTMASNHLGHFLLTHLLLDDLKKTASSSGEARIVVLSSVLHGGMPKGGNLVQQLNSLKDGTPTPMSYEENENDPLDVDNLMLEREGSYSGLQAYKNSKLVNVYFTYELSKLLVGTGVTVNAICPGFMPNTDFHRHAGAGAQFMMRNLMGPILCFTGLATKPQEAATYVYDLASNEKYKGVNGKYYSHGEEKKSSDESYDEAKQKKLWDVSKSLMKIQEFGVVDPSRI